ncbi:hypothetical protein A9R55_16120 [Escherichia coli]|nr:hypothetical protein A9R52_15505 [Escherichia coli]OEI34292.1 hypothetical protein A9R55_16120 [Escherichia coli]OEI45560.1 hypothetical protein A9R54_16425 [Escherichia coli]
MAENGYGLAGLGMGKVKSINQYRLTPGFGGFTPVSHVTRGNRRIRKKSYAKLTVFS